MADRIEISDGAWFLLAMLIEMRAIPKNAPPNLISSAHLDSALQDWRRCLPELVEHHLATATDDGWVRLHEDAMMRAYDERGEALDRSRARARSLLDT